MSYRAPFDVSRRRVLKYGIGGAVLLAGGGYVATRLTDGGITPSVGGLAHLNAGAQSVFRAISDAVLDGQLPEEPAARKAAIDDVLRGIDVSLAALPAASRKEIVDLLGLVAVAPTRFLLGGRWRSWETASRANVTTYLDGLRSSSMVLKRTAYLVLRDLPVTAFYSDRRNWALIGYGGPLVDREV